LAAVAPVQLVDAPAATELVGWYVVEHVGAAVRIVWLWPLTKPDYDGVGMATDASP
jgi:hypothetical protein